MSLPFDTLDYAQQLAKAGATAAQAEQQSQILARFLSNSVALRSDQASLERSLVTKIEAFELKIDVRINALVSKVNLARWMLCILILLNMTIMLKLYVR